MLFSGMKHTYKITRVNEWKNFSGIMVTLVFLIVISPIIFYLRTPDGNFFDYIPFIIIGFLLLFIPVSVIHLRYQSINEGMEMEYDDMEKTVTIFNKKEDKTSEFGLEEIKHVFHTMTPPFSENRMLWFPWDSYNYSDIFLKDGRKYRITSLMVYKLHLPVGSKYEAFKSFYPYPNN